MKTWSGWHDLYALSGAGAATLVGLMFVTASIGAGVVTRQHQPGIRSFRSPTGLHFSAVLRLCLIASIPGTWLSMGIYLVGAGLIGLGYSCLIWRPMREHRITPTVDPIDRLW